MELMWAALALDVAESQDDPSLVDVVGLGLDSLWILDCPARLKCVLLLGFKGTFGEFDGATGHPLQVALAAAGRVVWDADYDFVPTTHSDRVPDDWDKRTIDTAELRFTADRTGPYSVDVWFKGKRHLDSPYFMVRQVTDDL
jgi:hypothetical protein